jgi:hypothetical protein
MWQCPASSCLSRHTKVHYCLHKNTLMDPTLPNTNLVHTLTDYLRYILTLFSHTVYTCR